LRFRESRAALDLDLVVVEAQTALLVLQELLHPVPGDHHPIVGAVALGRPEAPPSVLGGQVCDISVDGIVIGHPAGHDQCGRGVAKELLHLRQKAVLDGPLGAVHQVPADGTQQTGAEVAVVADDSVRWRSLQPLARPYGAEGVVLDAGKAEVAVALLGKWQRKVVGLLITGCIGATRATAGGTSCSSSSWQGRNTAAAAAAAIPVVVVQVQVIDALREGRRFARQIVLPAALPVED